MRDEDAAAAGMEERLTRALAPARSREEGIRIAVEAIRASSPDYHWTGIYLLEGADLVLAHEVGRPTPHRRISLDSGICGAAAREGRTIVVDDVNADPRYLACSLETRSEIVVPLRDSGRVIGEIDIDSDRAAAFGDADRSALERAAEIVSRFLGSHASAPGRPHDQRSRARVPRLGDQA